MEPILINNVEGMPRTDYPRPQWKRKDWYCLNGDWEFAFDFGNSGIERGMVEGGDYPLTIHVPFCPESKLSGIGYTDFMAAVWYRRKLVFEKLPRGRALLHFGAVDYACKVWVNGIYCGSHTGGYTPFEMDITEVLKEGENIIVVNAQDDIRSGKQPRGKQSVSYNSKTTRYTRTTGIWQSVWLEFVPERYLHRSEMVPHAVDGRLDITVFVKNPCPFDRVRLTAYYNGSAVGGNEVCVGGECTAACVTVDEVHLWNPGAPELYDLTLELLDGKTGEVIDVVESYFALRDVAMNGTALTINGHPVFMRLVLDQGFNSEGICTAPDDEFLKRDIELSMELGFNGARLHARVFEERTMYWADRLGYIVWGEFAGGFSLETAQSIEIFLPEWMEYLQRDYNHPSIIGWCCFNETYHRMILDENTHRLLYRVTKALDPYRPVIDASGGMHYETDMFDVHDYEQDPKKLAEYLAPMLEDEKAFHSPISRYRGDAPCRPDTYTGQPYWVSEYGGTFWNTLAAQNSEAWGYGENPADEEEFAARYENLTKVLLEHPRVCGFCYTQLTDIEQEQNGLYYYDRTRKLPDWVYERIRAINTRKAAVEK